MKATDLPALVGTPFGENGIRTAISQNTSPGTNAASYNDGFPRITMTDLDKGGLPPRGSDFNQILYELAKSAQWAGTGALYKYSKEFAEKIGGYPKGSKVTGSDGSDYESLEDDNKNDPVGSESWASAGSDANTRELWRRSLAEIGLNLVDGSFQSGARVLKATDAVWDIKGAQCYTWIGPFPHDAKGDPGQGWKKTTDADVTSYNLKKQGNVEGWRLEYPDDTDCINAALSSGATHVFTDKSHGEYIVRSGEIYIRKGQSFDTSNAKLKRVDNEINRRNIVEMDDGAILNLEVDGNYQNNIYDAHLWTSVDTSPFAQNIFMGRRDTSTTGTKLAVGCIVNYVKSYNGIRSCLVACGSGHQFNRLDLRDSYIDHWMYFSSASTMYVDNLVCGGLCRAEGISFGTDENAKAIDVKIGKITITDINYVKFPWYELPPRYVSARYKSHENCEIGTINITDLSTPVISDDLQIHRRVAIYESPSPFTVGKISVKTIVKNSRSLITVESNSASIGVIDVDYVNHTYASGSPESSIVKSTGTSSQPTMCDIGKISVRGDGKSSRIAIATSSKMNIDTVVAMTGATGFGSILYASATSRDASISVGQWVGGNFFSQFSDTSELNNFSATVDLLCSSLARITIVGNQTVNNPGSYIIQLSGSNGVMVNRLRYFKSGNIVVLIGDGLVTFQHTTFLINKSGSDLLSVNGQPYAYLISLDGKAYQI